MTDEPQQVHVQDSETGSAADAQPGQQENPLHSDIRQFYLRWQHLVKENKAELEALARMGAGIDMGYLNKVRLDAFIEFVIARMGNAPAEVRQLLQLQFECLFEEKVADDLKEAKSEIRKAMLAAPPDKNIQAMMKNGSGPFSKR